jgi:hypothetical protein
VPFAILFISDWILSGGGNAFTQRNRWTGRVAAGFYLLLFLNFIVLQPLYYAQGSVEDFAARLKTAAVRICPWTAWNFIMLDPESKVRFYLHLPPTVKNEGVSGPRTRQTLPDLLKIWPILKKQPEDTIFITRKMYQPILRPLLKNYEVIEERSGLIQSFLRMDSSDVSIAFIPEK